MARVKRGVPGRARRKKVLTMAAGYRGRASEVYSVALEKVEIFVVRISAPYAHGKVICPFTGMDCVVVN